LASWRLKYSIIVTTRAVSTQELVIGSKGKICASWKGRVASAIVGIVIGFSLQSAAPAQNSQSDEAAIRRAIVEMTDAFNQHDAVAATRMYTPDADFVSVRGDKAKGRAEVEKLLAALFEARARKDAALRTEAVEIRFIRPDVAIVHVTNEMSGLVAPDEQKLPSHQEMSLRVFVKDNGQWQIAAFHNTMARCRPL
jgi:uncharacterized protein (TIGR02246 family)